MRLRPLSWWFSWRPGAAGALAVTLPEAASQREFFPLCLVLPLQGSVTFLAFVPQLEALSESFIPSLSPSWWWPCPLLRWALLPLSSYVLSVPSAVSLRSIPSHCCPSCPMSLLTVSVIGAQRGVSPCVWSRGALGELQWLHLYRLTPGLVGLRHFAVSRWSSGRCFILFLRDVPHVFLAIFL